MYRILMKITLYFLVIFVVNDGVYLCSALEKELSQFVIVQLTDIHYRSNPPKETPIPWIYRISLGSYKLHRKNLAKGKDIVLTTSGAIGRVNKK